MLKMLERAKGRIGYVWRGEMPHTYAKLSKLLQAPRTKQHLQVV